MEKVTTAQSKTMVHKLLNGSIKGSMAINKIMTTPRGSPKGSIIMARRPKLTIPVEVAANPARIAPITITSHSFAIRGVLYNCAIKIATKE